MKPARALSHRFRLGLSSSLDSARILCVCSCYSSPLAPHYRSTCPTHLLFHVASRLWYTKRQKIMGKKKSRGRVRRSGGGGGTARNNSNSAAATGAAATSTVAELGGILEFQRIALSKQREEKEQKHSWTDGPKDETEYGWEGRLPHCFFKRVGDYST